MRIRSRGGPVQEGVLVELRSIPEPFYGLAPTLNQHTVSIYDFDSVIDPVS